MENEIIYVDFLRHCHRTNDGTMPSVETSFFLGKCDAYVEGYCYDTSKGYTSIYPWQDSSHLDEVQRSYEQQKLKEYESLINELYAEVTS